MKTTLDRFLRYLSAERNASELTIKSYREDLLSLTEFLSDDDGNPTRTENVTTLDLRDYVAALNEAGYARSSISRRLASARSFFRYAQREGLIETNPAANAASFALVRFPNERSTSWPARFDARPVLAIPSSIFFCSALIFC